MARRNTKNKERFLNSLTYARIISATIFSALGLLVALGMFDLSGTIGQNLYLSFVYTLGYIGTVITAILLLLLGIHFFIYKEKRPPYLSLLYVFLFMCGLITFFSLALPSLELGGVFGVLMGSSLSNLIGSILAGIVSMSVALFFGYLVLARYTNINLFGLKREDDLETMEVHTDDGVAHINLSEESLDDTKEIPILGIGKKPTSKQSPEDTLEIIEPSRPVLESDYVAPPLKLFSESKGKPNVGDIRENASVIKQTLANFDIPVEMDQATVGPTVTRYALVPPAGVRLDRITALQKNLELALAAHPVRIEAPIPGKSLVGIEIPNKSKSIIGLRSMFTDPEFASSNKPLMVCLGKDVAGKSCYANLARLPHLLIAGATGSGKSVTVHNIILSLLYRNGPESLRLILVDPKRVELTLYNDISHLLTPVIKTPKKAILALKWAVKEMERRYDVLEKRRVRDIQSYYSQIVEPAYKNVRPADESTEESASELPERMPYIVIIIDELADIMQAYPKELESGIVRLAQMSRAVGIHLILSTQRPSKTVVTGLIKANIPGRIALRVSSNIDSRVILDSSGAEKLLGAGDMLYVGESTNTPKRMQCAFADEDEVKKVVKFITKHNISKVPDEIVLPDADDERSSGFGDDPEGDDPLFEDARQAVTEAGKASTSYLQRRLRVGYSRAARLMDMLEDAGIVGEQDGSKAREVYDQGDGYGSNDDTLDEDDES